VAIFCSAIEELTVCGRDYCPQLKAITPQGCQATNRDKGPRFAQTPYEVILCLALDWTECARYPKPKNSLNGKNQDDNN
jgi:hypothetical protein